MSSRPTSFIDFRGKTETFHHIPLRAILADHQLVTLLKTPLFLPFFAYYRPGSVPVRRHFKSLIDC